MSVYSLLKNNAGVTALTTQIYLTQAPQRTAPPYIVIDFTNINPENLLSEVPGIERQLISINCIAGDQATSVNLFKACRDALESNGYMLGLLIFGLRDSETGYFRTLFDYSFWENR